MPKKQLPVTPRISDLAKEWKTAKENETGWNKVRKQIEEKLKQEYGDFQQLVDSIGDEVLTTSAQIDGEVEVTVGFDMKTDQAKAIEFLSSYPTMTNVVFKLEYKPVAKAVLPIMARGDEMSKVLKEAVTFKPKNPGFKVV